MGQSADSSNPRSPRVLAGQLGERHHKAGLGPPGGLPGDQAVGLVVVLVFLLLFHCKRANRCSYDAVGHPGPNSQLTLLDLGKLLANRIARLDMRV